MEIREALFQWTNAAIQLDVGELDRPLRFGESPPHLVMKVRYSAVELLIAMLDALRDGLHLPFHFLRADIEVPANFRRVRLEESSQCSSVVAYPFGSREPVTC